MSKPNSTNLTAERLRELLHYNPETGVFTRLVKLCNSVHIGDIAGHKMTNNYIIIRVDALPYLAHRLAWLYITGEHPINYIDHINGDKSDNRIANLREATNSENKQNIKKARKDNNSGFLGAHWDKSAKKFRAVISVNGKKHTLGRYSTPQEAHQCYLSAKHKLHPFSTI